MLPSVTVYRAPQSWGSGRPEGWEGRGSGSYLSPATSCWYGTCYNALRSSRPPFPHLHQWQGWSSSSLRSFPALCNLFWNLVNERLMSILKRGRKGQRKAGKGEREVESSSPIICYGTLSKELSPVWTSVSFPLKWGSFIFNIPFNSCRLYVYKLNLFLSLSVPEC